jgi:hypothetical protein
MSILESLILELRSLASVFKDGRCPSPNLRYRLEDIVLSAFALFFTQAPSFLEYQRQHSSSNAETLFGIQQIPSDNHIRPILDKRPAENLSPAL